MKNNYIYNIKEINKYINNNIIIKGWIKNIKYFSKKKIIFIILRDNYSTIQILLNNTNFSINKIKNIFKIYKIEYFIEVHGIVKIRNTNNIISNKENDNLEIIVKKIKLINKSKKLPIDINKNFSDINKIKYRYLYFRNNNIIFDNILKRSKLLNIINLFMNKNNFINIETPIISKEISEGSKNFYIKSNIYKNKYSLSQSPQIFKQLLILSGFNKYYQISKCFRDENVRSDRQPEFTQLDIETSITENKYIIKLSEKLIKNIWNKINNIKIKEFNYIKYKDCIRMYGTDKPNINNNIILYNINNDIIKCKKKNNLFFINILKDNIIDINKILKNKIKYNFINFNRIFKIINNIINDNNKKNIIFNKLINIKNKKINSNIYLITYDKNIIYYINSIRNKIWEKIKIKENNIKPIWIFNFPMFEIKNNKIKCVNHPFTMPIIRKKYIKNNKINNPINIYSKSYDLIINGIEIASGTERINNYKLQKIIFNTLNISRYKQNKEFGFFINALKYGTPKHCGIALGIDRIMMLLTEEKDIKNTIAFPKTNSLLDITNI